LLTLRRKTQGPFAIAMLFALSLRIDRPDALDLPANDSGAFL
jgi:hypothetical protein